MDRYVHRHTTSRVLFLGAAASLAIGGLFSCVALVGAASAASGNKPKTLVISATENTKFGTILVSGGVRDRTVYTLKASKMSCGTRCLKIWPEVLLPKGAKSAAAGAGVSSANLGTVMRARGALQVTYAGKPLYWFSGDKAAGQVNGNVTDKWGAWSVYVMPNPAASPPPAPAANATPTTGPTPTTPAPTPRVTTPTPMTSAPATPPPPPPPPPTTAPTTTTTAPSGGGSSF